MIQLSYRCACGAKTSDLDTAQKHADATGHVVTISGSMTSREPVVSSTKIAESAERKMREAAILRLARDRGLLKVVRA